MVLQKMAAPTRVGTVGAYSASADPALVREVRARAGSVTVGGEAGLKVLSALDRGGDLAGVDLDPAGYLSSQHGQLELIEVDWVARQRELGLRPVRSPGVFVPAKGDPSTAVIGPLPDDVHRVVSLHSAWLRHDRSRTLLAALRSADGPLSLVFADPFDPFDGVDAISSLREVLAELRGDGRAVELLRCDLTGLGFVADGGRYGSVGVTTSTRHHPQPLGRAAGAARERRQRTPYVFLPGLLSWHKATWLLALAPFGGAGLTGCNCDACEGQSLLRFAQEWPGQVPAQVRADARAHDICTWRSVADAVLSAANPAGAWRARVDDAQRLQLQLADLYKVAVALPRSLTAWSRSY